MGASAAAGKSSPHLEEEEQAQAAEHASPPALVIHEVVREDGEAELRRSKSAIAWSGLAAGLSMGFSFLALALMRGLLPDAPASHFVFAAGYTVGFVIAILGRQELFTESTLTAVLPLLVRRDRRTLVAVLRFWAVVLAANVVGTTLFGALLTVPELFDDATHAALVKTAKEATAGAFTPTLLRAVLSGWLIALMPWLLPSAKSARLFVILLLTYVVAIGGFPHIVAGSVEAAFAMFSGGVSWQQAAIGFYLPTLIGNTVGGVALVAVLNHAPLSEELQEEPRRDGEASRPPSRRGKPARTR